ncbi:MAG: OmpA family protein [Flavobacteriales bacterium]|nr:OmpA family protein [Flavobacteriales bacterium]
MRKFIIYLCLGLGHGHVFGQQPAMPKEAADLLKRAEKALAGGSTQFARAEALLEQALALAPDHGELNLRMGLCQLNGPARYKSLPFFLKAQAAMPEMPRIDFLVGFAQQLDQQWDAAVASYERHKHFNRSQDEQALYNTADKRIAECKHGKALMAVPVRAEVRNMGPKINSPQADYGALITADGKELIYTSRRPTDPDAELNKETLDHFEDIRTSRSVDGGWGASQLLPAPVNSAANDASVGLFNDGRTLIIYRDKDGSGDLFESKRVGDSWSEPTALGPNINSRDHESSAWFSFDRQWLYFVSDRAADNVGGQDIYRSKWDAAANDWGPAENLGPTVNTIHDEEGVFVHPDGRTLYFSSKGHNSMGGYDVFRSRLENGRWSDPQNMGWPINSPDDDLFFVLTANGSTGYLSSLRADGLGEDDLYEVTFLPDMPQEDNLLVSVGSAAPVVEDELPSTVLLKGKIMDLKMLAGMEASIEMVDLEDASLVARFKSDATTGEYLVALPAGRRYAMYVKADGFLVYSETVEMPPQQRNMEVDLDIDLKSLDAGSQVTMKNIFFATASAELHEDSEAEFDQLQELLTKNPALKLEIGGHTDTDGSAEFNRKLSEQRAIAVRDELVKRGIDQGRLSAVGFGDSQPVADNDTDANKAKNRRTEVKVL